MILSSCSRQSPVHDQPGQVRDHGGHQKLHHTLGHDHARSAVRASTHPTNHRRPFFPRRVRARRHHPRDAPSAVRASTHPTNHRRPFFPRRVRARTHHPRDARSTVRASTHPTNHRRPLPFAGSHHAPPTDQAPTAPPGPLPARRGESRHRGARAGAPRGRAASKPRPPSRSATAAPEQSRTAHIARPRRLR